VLNSRLPIVLFGDGGHALSVIDLLKARGAQEIYICGKPDMQKRNYFNLITRDEISRHLNDFQLALAIGDQKIRNEFMAQNKDFIENGRFPALIHPRAYVSQDSVIGKGAVILSNAYVGPSVSIGDFSIINTHAIVEHGCNLGKSVILSPNATLCGDVKIGSNTFLGVGACVSPRLELGENVTVGACSFVLKSVKSNRLVYGTPARVIK